MVEGYSGSGDGEIDIVATKSFLVCALVCRFALVVGCALLNVVYLSMKLPANADFVIYSARVSGRTLLHKLLESRRLDYHICAEHAVRRCQTCALQEPVPHNSEIGSLRVTSQIRDG